MVERAAPAKAPHHFGVVVPPAPAALLLRRAFLSFVPGEMGLFSAPLVIFFPGAKGVVALVSDNSAGFVGIDVCILSEDCGARSRVLDIMNDLGSPTRGFSSMYSLP